jgi:hypothetical protein
MHPHRPWILNGSFCWTVLLAFCCLALFPVETRAALVESRLASGETISERSVQIETIRQALEKEVVHQRLADYGLSQEEILAKLPTLSDAQLHQLAALSDDIVAGDALGGVIAVLVIILLVVLILKVSGKEIIIR